MQKTKMNFRIFLNFLILTGVITFLASCARERASLSYQNDALKKYSLEIENGETFVSTSEVKVSGKENFTETKNQNNSLIEVKDKITKEEKLSPVEKIAVKKLAKKIKPENIQRENQTNALDKNLKIAIILGAAGVLLSIFGWPLYFIGGVLVVVGIVFLILWLMEQ